MHPVDYVYHGDAHRGFWASREQITGYVLKYRPKSEGAVYFGPLTIQSWKKNLNFENKKNDGRNDIQIKAQGVLSVLNNISLMDNAVVQNGTFEGTLTEISYVRLFNRDPKSEVFSEYVKKLGLNTDITRAVRVTTRQTSSLVGKKVLPKSDAYAIEIYDPSIDTVIEENGFLLDEGLLSPYYGKYRIIEYSGISIKIDGSESYQIVKLNPESFYSVFGSYELGCGISLFVEKEEELPKNMKIMEGWNTDCRKMGGEFGEADLERNLVSSKPSCKRIKELADSRIRGMIDGDHRIQEMLFNGIGVFSEPYAAHFLLQNEKASVLKAFPYYITTGSGRSNGQYSVEIKPKKSASAPLH